MGTNVEDLIQYWSLYRLNEAAVLSSYLHAFPLSVPLQAWLAWLGTGTFPRSPSKLICCTSTDDNIFILWTQFTNSLNAIRIKINTLKTKNAKKYCYFNCRIPRLTPMDHHQQEVCHFRDPHKQASSQFSVDLLVALQSQTCGLDHA